MEEEYWNTGRMEEWNPGCRLAVLKQWEISNAMNE